MSLKSTDTRPRPTWVRGPASIKGDEIVLDASRSESYSAFEPEHCEALLSDLAALRDFEMQDPVEFCERHGLIWHGPDQVSDGQCREPLQRWRAAGLYLSMTMTLYLALRSGMNDGSDEQVRDLLWMYRDGGLFIGRIPDDKDGRLEYASEQIAELITRGLEGCTPKLLTASSLSKPDGEKVGPAGRFHLGIVSNNLMAPAYWYLASMIHARAEFRECAGCGRLFRPEHGSQIYHKKNCANSNRQRKHRQEKSESSQR